jgi:signal peptidase I
MRRGWLRENSKLLIEVLVTVFFLNAFILQSFGIPTSSMEDNMLVGDHLLAGRAAYFTSSHSLDRLIFPMEEIQRGDIVILKAPPEIKARNLAKLLYVKRVVGLPGENIRIVGNRVQIDGTFLEEPYVFLKGGPLVPAHFPPESPGLFDEAFPSEYRDRLIMTEAGPVYRIPEGHYFCMGDNRNVSVDSRIWGPLPLDHVVAKPWRIYWSYDRNTDFYLNRGFFNRLTDIARNFFSRTRWERILKRY